MIAESRKVALILVDDWYLSLEVAIVFLVHLIEQWVECRRRLVSIHIDHVLDHMVRLTVHLGYLLTLRFISARLVRDLGSIPLVDDLPSNHVEII